MPRFVRVQRNLCGTSVLTGEVVDSSHAVSAKLALGGRDAWVGTAHERGGSTHRAGAPSGRYGPLSVARQEVVFVQKNGVLSASCHVTVTVKRPAALAAFNGPKP